MTRTVFPGGGEKNVPCGVVIPLDLDCLWHSFLYFVVTILFTSRASSPAIGPRFRNSPPVLVIHNLTYFHTLSRPLGILTHPATRLQIMSKAMRLPEPCSRQESEFCENGL